MKQTKTFAPGDRVAYSAAWLKSTGQQTGDAPHLRGTVVGVASFGKQQLITIAWDGVHIESDYHDDGFGRVIAPNLTLVSRIAIDAALA